jgi:hypothetical protein
MPPDASPPQGGPIFDALVPDFVSVWNADQTAIAGYVPKAYLVGRSADLPGSPSSPPQSEPEPVYGEDLTTLVGHMVAGMGFVPLGATAPPPSPAASLAPSPAGSPSPVASGGPSVDCGRISQASCEQAVALARAGNEAELAGATRVVVDDACAPSPVICDRYYPFDAIVVFVTAGADTTGWYAFEVTGPEYSTPTTALPLSYAIPAHIVAKLTAISLPSPSVAPDTPLPASPPPARLTSPPPGQITRFETAAFSADRRTLTLHFVGGPEYSASDPCSIAYSGWAEAAGDVLYAAVVDVTQRVRPPEAPTPQACDAMGHGRTVSVALAAPFSGGRLVDLAGYVHLLRTPDGLVELHGLPAGLALQSASDVEDSPTGRWLRVYTPSTPPQQGTSKGRLELYQAFGGPVEVSGGDEVRSVLVNGQPATLYRLSADGELVLVWTLRGDGLAIVANEADFSTDALIRLAESATLP